jgi:hypothetical protein
MLFQLQVELIFGKHHQLIEKVHILKRITNSARLFNPLQLTNEVVKQHIKHVVSHASCQTN